MLLSGEEHHALVEICDEYGLTMSDVIRLLIRKEHARFGSKQPLAPLEPRKSIHDDAEITRFLAPEKR